MTDGLYRVVTKRFVAGFIVQNGLVVRYAPILYLYLSYWKTKGKWIAP